MPMLLSTPERWFRTHQCDFFEFRPSESNEDLPIELTEWFAGNLPNRPLKRLGPSEYSGFICGGASMLVLAMNDDEVQMFSRRWEDASGKSIDPRWQCFQWPYLNWRTKLDGVEVFKGPVSAGTNCRWLLCEVGLDWLRGQYSSENIPSNAYPGDPTFDDWWIVCQHFPEVRDATQTPFIMGVVFTNTDAGCSVIFESYQRKENDVAYGIIFSKDEQSVAAQKVSEALAPPPNTAIAFGFF